ncbi:hypothetical protein BATDEDRAFT_34302 [Batrachochytrium dendrobatidis JAM81]|uniref:Membrane insertase YidC/Oxa/ALB C-terminal domain-containing protein n=2 Tax=Batrachochytrium dendrobatidis TaxID=109871 RepID=F4NUR9_BATDJ|nr:membrane insertase OXA1 [Batrachochytrium dendrobatidis JAM81]EGF84433.1 hypothetical protein BATDEDRAFT_34302 [Batrachochytrium dendrobatidis JAM81]OAJ37489.1 hypothetical protein BDEG_21504 [Batrachochytrium dendrobatidis JEL423]|eukprot:XP_006675818.1 hypothetical protein BATDEDRAFT_34302 [Batrachochytrium dendrobatidis JAM81]
MIPQTAAAVFHTTVASRSVSSASNITGTFRFLSALTVSCSSLHLDSLRSHHPFAAIHQSRSLSSSRFPWSSNQKNSLFSSTRFNTKCNSIHSFKVSQSRSFWSFFGASTTTSTQALVDAPIVSAPSIENATNTASTVGDQILNEIPVEPISAIAEGTNIGDLMTETALGAITQIGDLHSLGLANYNPVGLFQIISEYIYVYSGMPWWATIVALTIIVRIIVAPLAIKAQVAGAVLGGLRPKTDPIQKRVTHLRSIGDTAGSQREAQKLFQVYKDNNISPLSIGWGIIQAPIFISVFMAIKYMAELPVPGFTTGGFGWITNLSTADPTYILPILSSIGMLITMEYSPKLTGSPPQSAMILMIMRVASVVMIPVMGGLPVAVFIYMLVSTVLMIAQMYLLSIPAIRVKLGLSKVVPAAVMAPPGMLVVSPIGLTHAAKAIQEARRDFTKSTNVISQSLDKK